METNLPTHYRYERRYSLDQTVKSIELIKYEAIRETNGGYWLKQQYSADKFVLKVSNRRFAYPTKEEAFDSFTKRTKKSFQYAKRDMLNAETFLMLIKEFKIK